ncbi:5-hydroxytryptamine receptor 3A-like [Discoglossus pictus]
MLVDFEMSWVNQLLSWTPGDFCEISRISIPEGSVWIPDIFIFEMTEDDSLDVPYLHLYHDGTIQQMKTLKFVISCLLDLYKFPFDTQMCQLTFGTRTNPASDVVVIPGYNEENLTSLSKKNFVLGEWNLIRVNASQINISKYGEEWSKVVFEFVIQRAPILYVINLIIPACLLVLVDVASMFIPMEGGERMGFKITIVLGFSVLLLILNDFLPSTNNPPILGVFCMVCLLIMIISIIDSIFITYMLHLSAIRPNVPNWLRVWILVRLAFVLRIDTKSRMESLSAQNKDVHVESSIVPINTNKLRSSEKKSADNTEIRLLKKLLLELLMVRRHLVDAKQEEEAKSEWHIVAFVLDRFILILYLITVVFIMVTVVLVWII